MKTGHRRPFRNSVPYVVEKGDMITTTGIRGRTRVVRMTDENGKRVTGSVRIVDTDVKQTPAKGTGDRKPKGIFIGRTYTGVARSKPYPYAGAKRGGSPAPVTEGLLSKASKAMKRVVVGA
jgi:hypothetical protein